MSSTRSPAWSGEFSPRVATTQCLLFASDLGQPNTKSRLSIFSHCEVIYTPQYNHTSFVDTHCEAMDLRR